MLHKAVNLAVNIRHLCVDHLGGLNLTYFSCGTKVSIRAFTPIPTPVAVIRSLHIR